MTYISWTSDLDTGIGVIDNQHRRIVEYINQLDDVAKHPDKMKVAEVLDELVDYTLSHFTFEESLMEEAGYPFIKAHKKVHELFAKRIANYVQRFRMDEDITEELIHTLKAWLINHIRNDDNDYSEIVRTNMNTIDSRKKESWLRKLFG
jgi:hemerythrin